MAYFSPIKRLLKNPVQWYQKVGLNEYGNIQWAPPQTIKVFFEPRTSLIRKNDQETVVSKGIFFSIDPINIGDKINDGVQDWYIIDIYRYEGRNGQVHLREAYA